MNKLASIFLAGVVSISSINNALAEDGGLLAAENFSATLTFKTDYAFRGASFSDRGPVVQGSFDWSYGPWFFGIWGGNGTPSDNTGVNDNNPGGTLTSDIHFGWADAIGGFDVMIMPLFYIYPDQQGADARDDNTFELWTSVGRSLEGVAGSPYIKLEFDWSPELYDGGDASFYIKPSVAFTLPGGFGLDFGYGYQDIGDYNYFYADDFAHIDVGISTQAAGFNFDLRYHDNLDTDTLGYGYENHFVFSISRSF